MEIAGTIAPSYEELRPMREQTKTDWFPIYEDLVDLLRAPDKHPKDEIAHTLAVCSAYAYGHESSVAIMMARMGLEKNHCLRISESVDAMLIRSTAFLVQSADGSAVILCFRGTAMLDFINWLVDIDVNPGNVPVVLHDKEYPVHGGFYRNVRSIRFEILHALDRALKQESVLPERLLPAGTDKHMPAPLQAVYVTGHSLGGAMAVLMTLMLQRHDYESVRERLQATYTYGQPMVGEPDLAEACRADDFLGRNVIRYVYGNDIVPQVPPSFTGDFAHFGQEYRFKTGVAGGYWSPSKASVQLRNPLLMVAAPLSIFTHQIRRYRNLRYTASVEDHFPRYYVAALTPADARTEFGD